MHYVTSYVTHHVMHHVMHYVTQAFSAVDEEMGEVEDAETAARVASLLEGWSAWRAELRTGAARTAAASAAYGCSLAHARLQPRLPIASATHGCGLCHLRLQRLSPTVAAPATYGCRRREPLRLALPARGRRQRVAAAACALLLLVHQSRARQVCLDPRHSA